MSEDRKYIAEIDLMENATYVVRDGILEKVDSLPTGFGKQTITYENGKWTRVEINYSKR
ncbi:DUF3954 domain-containing protein [Priestia aryabhattai]|uniref:DUF3954 domain-containing protein n=1 Tax=Priestia aryabhattai TaxID=412384 RepID=UPI002E1F9877|nr:DUF3954 domain-containing protein [Priestia aryabhattai]MED4257711.1 DUF3954 domain-containing protein [Priestia aryabhattai]